MNFPNSLNSLNYSAYSAGVAVHPRANPNTGEVGADSYAAIAGAVAAAQQESAAIHATKAEAERVNAASTAGLAQAGLSVGTLHMSDSYRDHMLKMVDSDRDGSVSMTELLAGMGDSSASLERARKLYNAMDIDGDGAVSGDEFKDSLADPLSTAGGRNILEQMKQAMQKGKPLDGDYLTDRLVGASPINELLNRMAVSLDSKPEP